MSFPLGKLVATPGALQALEKSGEGTIKFLKRHKKGDWGDVCTKDADLNNKAVNRRLRILSAYRTALNTRLWVITEADRSYTCMLLPEEY